MNKIPYNMSEDSITVFCEGKPYTVREDHANFKPLQRALIEARYDDVAQYVDVMSVVKDFVDGDLEVKDECLFFRGHELHGVVVEKLIQLLKMGLKDSSPIVNYIKRLQSNPSNNSVNELYTFLGYKSLPITEDGKIWGYKGVRDDYWSSTGNTNTVVIQGKTNESGQIFNGVGETIEVARHSVDDNKDNHCSNGLHVGSYDYANSWSGHSGKLLVVEFDPKDAVSVPTDCDFQKLRVCKYKVIRDITEAQKELKKNVIVVRRSDDDEPYAGDECEEDYSDDYEDEDFESYYEDDGEDDCDDVEYNPEEMAIRNYIENKHDDGVEPTIKQVLSRMVGSGLTCQQIKYIVLSQGFNVEEDENISLSQSRILIGQ